MTRKIIKNKNVGKNVAKLPNDVSTLENNPYSLKKVKSKLPGPQFNSPLLGVSSEEKKMCP